MRNVVLFMMITLDGFFEGPDHDISWHNVDRHFNRFAAKQLKDAGTLVFGRKTYELMHSYWPTAIPSDPQDAQVTDSMNSMPKVVVSSSLSAAPEEGKWKNILLVNDGLLEQFTKLKKMEGGDILVLGSSRLCVSLLQLNLLDRVRLMINPVVIGDGTRLFYGIDKKVNLQLKTSRAFTSGNVLCEYSVEK